MFSIIHRAGGQQAAHPDYKGPLPSGRGEDVLNRVGTAWRQRDGSYFIQLMAFPVNGQLVLKPMSDEAEQATPYHGEAR